MSGKQQVEPRKATLTLIMQKSNFLVKKENCSWMKLNVIDMKYNDLEKWTKSNPSAVKRAIKKPFGGTGQREMTDEHHNQQKI